MSFKLLISMVLALFISLIFISNAIVYNDCRDSHVFECEQAHNMNKTYSYCSGFLYEPTELDKNIFCSFHPDEGCEQIPHGCVLPENEYFAGLKIPFTNIEWRFSW